MGRVLLAGLPSDALDAYFSRVTLEPLTERTVTDEGRLRATLAEVAETGWAIVDQELEEGVRSVAAPLVNADGRTVAALNVSGHATRVTLDTLRRSFLPRVLETAARINADLRTRR
jgi:IclR family pca regulon transcriptional regulator